MSDNTETMKDIPVNRNLDKITLQAVVMLHDRFPLAGTHKRYPYAVHKSRSNDLEVIITDPEDFTKIYAILSERMCQMLTGIHIVEEERRWALWIPAEIPPAVNSEGLADDMRVSVRIPGHEMPIEATAFYNGNVGKWMMRDRFLIGTVLEWTPIRPGF